MTAPVLTKSVTRQVVDWQMMRRELDYFNELAMRDLLGLFRQAQSLDNYAARRYLADGLAAVVETYGAPAGELTSMWWFDLLGGDIETFTVAELPSYEQLTKEVAWGVAAPHQEMALARLATVVQKHIFGAHRNTANRLAIEKRVGYARYAQPDACAFCRLLASRGAVYGSATAANYVGMARTVAHYSDGRRRGSRFKKARIRGERTAGQKYHDHCRCVAGPLADNLDPNFPSYYSDFEDEYLAATAEIQKRDPGAALTMQNVTKMMRLQGAGR